MSDNVGISNISAYSRGLVGYQTPNIDRIASEGMLFTDYYAEQSCMGPTDVMQFILSNFTNVAEVRQGIGKITVPSTTAKSGRLMLAASTLEL